MQIISDDREKTGCITAIIAGRWVQAKVYDDPSDYGVHGGRVSKLAISFTRSRNPNANFEDQMQYTYDRGHGNDKDMPEILFARILAELEALPKALS